MLKGIDEPGAVKPGPEAKNYFRSHGAYRDGNDQHQGKGQEQYLAYPQVPGCQDPVDRQLQIKRREHLQKFQQQGAHRDGEQVSPNARHLAKKLRQVSVWDLCGGSTPAVRSNSMATPVNILEKSL